jgi:transglutaminase-like putative cysteine protease
VVTFRVRHETEYRYASSVSASYGQAHLLLRDTDSQQCRSCTLDITPRPDTQRTRTDFFGNRAVYFSVSTAHTVLRVVSTSDVDVATRPAPSGPAAGVAWEDVVERIAAPTTEADLDARAFVFDSPRVPSSPTFRAYAAEVFTPGRAVVDAVAALSHRIHTEFRFDAEATDVSTPVSEAFDRRVGVCQDFSHVAVACLRSLGLPARYVSGYLETVPPPGRARLVGADVSHAWVSVYLPDLGWCDIDPTNDQWVEDRYVVTAWGRDYGDIPPLKGVIFTESAKSKLTVKVDVTRV